MQYLLVRAAGSFVAGAPLKPTATAASVRVRGGEELVTDGPFAETKQQLGGYHLVDVAGIDEATALARGLPAARDGTVEVRPLQPLPAGPAAAG